jgi:hypothetical protein
MKIALLPALLALLALPLHAAEAPSAKLIKDLEGVYRNKVQSQIVMPGKPDEKFEAEDVVEVVRHDDQHVFLRAALSVANGHRCSIGVIAGLQNGTFTYRDPNPDFSDKLPCTLTMVQKGESLVLSDRASPRAPSSCSVLCGKRASLGDYIMPMSSKGKIASLPKIKASKEYQEALKAFEETQR